MPFSFFSFLLCGSNSVGSLLHRLKDKPGHGGAKGRLWRELSEGVFPSLTKAGETGMARRLMRMLKRLEEDFPQLQCHQPVQDDAPPPTSLPTQRARLCVRITPATKCNCRLPIGEQPTASVSQPFRTLSASRPMFPRVRIPGAVRIFVRFPLRLWFQFCWCAACVSCWSTDSTAQQSSKLAGRFTQSPAVLIVLITPHVCVR